MRENKCNVCGNQISKMMPCRFEYHGYFGIRKMNVCVYCFQKFKYWIREQKKEDRK